MALLRRFKLLLTKEVLPSLWLKQMTWLLVKNPSELDEQEQEDLTVFRQASGTADTAYELVQAFGQMVRERRGERASELAQSG